MTGDALWLLSWNLRNGLVPPDRSLGDTLRRRRGPAACTDKEHLITGMLPQEGGFAIMLQETGIATRAQEMHVAAALRDKGYTAFFSSRLAETGATSTSRGGGLLTAVSSKYVAEHEVLRLTEIVPGKAAALEIRTDGGGLTLINVHGPQAGCSPWAGRAAFWADIQMYALGFLEQALRRADQPEPAPILDLEGNKYHAHWERGVPLYHKTSITVHAHPDLGVDGRLGAYECVGPGWQLNVLLTHVPFGEETKDFLDTLSLAYRRLSLLAPTIIIGDLNAAPTDDDRTGPPTATDTAVQDAMHQLGLTDLTAGLTGTPSHYPHQAGTHPSRIDTCYGDPSTVRVHEAAYRDLPPTGTGHRPLYIDLIIPNLPPPAATLPDDTLPPTLQFPAEDDHGAWHRYNRALHAILRRPGAPTLTTAMRRAAQACGMERDTNHTGAPPDLTLQQLVHDIWTTKGELATLLRPSTPEARDRDAHLRALLTTRRHQLQEWHAHRIAAAAQERERYGRKDTPYQSLRYVSRILEDTGRRTIHAIRVPEGGLTNDPDAVLEAVLDSFQAQHGDAVICLCLGAYRKPIFLVLHLKIKLFPMFSITIDLVGKYRTQATARRRSRERTLSWTNWLVQ